MRLIATSFLAALLIMLPALSFTQTTSVSGKVTDAKTGEPLSGATILIKGTKIGTTTNNEGMFTIQVTAGKMLEVSMVEHKTVAVKFGTSELQIALASLEDMDPIVLVGTHRTGRVKLETAVPIDVVQTDRLKMSTGRMDLTSVLNYTAPSFNYNKQSGSDGADHIELATLRGLGPDQTLVLVNGKRHHQTSFVTIFGSRGRGNSGTDLNTIPMSAIDRVEILRDGASAQYGSDAIAGVINIILKKDVNILAGNVGYSGYYDKKYNPAFKDMGQYASEGKLDGNALSANLNYGVSLGKRNGFLNMSADFLSTGKTFRQSLDTNFSNKDGLPINYVRRGNGDASMDMASTMYNMELPTDEHGTVFYSNGGYTSKKSDAFAFSRNFSAKPERFPTDANDDLIFVNGIMFNTPDGELYYNPHIQTHDNDFAFTAGLRGGSASKWMWDLSNTMGKNDFHFYGDKTFNASLGNVDQIHFDDGGFSFSQSTTTFNLDRDINKVAKGCHLSLGAAYRSENYKIYAGEERSYTNYSNGDKATGSQGFPGFQPADVVDAKRNSVSIYSDVEMDVTKSLLVSGALRVENYSDFGSTANYKLALRLKVVPGFNLRGSVSTGFRAPSLQQVNYSSTFTTVQAGEVAEVKIAPNGSAIATAAGIPDLKQETSVNGSFGFTWKPAPELSITTDAYYVQVKDRVVLSGQFDAEDATLDPVLIQSLQNLNVAYAQFFANAVNTTNKGIDLVIDYNKRLAGDRNFKALLAANFQKMNLDKINVPSKLDDTESHRKTFYSDREQAFLLASAPNMKLALSLEYGLKKWKIGMRGTLFGKLKLLGYGEDGLGIDPQVPTDNDPAVYVADQFNIGSKLVTDLYASYKFNNKFELFAGADNFLGIHPDMSRVASAKWWAFNNETGGPWDAVQMGSNGMRLFVRLGFNF